MAVSGSLCLMAWRIARMLSLIDMPDGPNGRKRHAGPTPLVGGLAVILPLLGGLLLVPLGSLPFAATLGFAALAMLFLGMADDRVHLSPVLRLAIATMVLMIAIVVGEDFNLGALYFSFVHGVFGIGYLGGAALALLCLLGLQNAVNMADGKNGLVIGLAMIWTGFLILTAPAGLRPILFILLAALAVTWLFNLSGRLFLGDGGSYAISIAIGLLAIYSYNQQAVLLPADVVALWFLVPVLDCLRLIVARLRRGMGPFTPDRSHFHHILADNLPWSAGLAVYLGMVAVPGLIAIAMPDMTPLLFVVTILTYSLIYVTMTRLQLIAAEMGEMQ
ncbi:MAG: hypothetical protein ACOY99_02570 [Pseudomonadota bacterium]